MEVEALKKNQGKGGASTDNVVNQGEFTTFQN